MRADLSKATWRKSSFSGDGASCVEVAATKDVIAIRDTKNRAGGILTFRPDEWHAFIVTVKQASCNLGGSLRCSLPPGAASTPLPGRSRARGP
ncbi:DUF397 domain-containing protein [Thermopolyspora sp. NPDC052614]|uniref:DUF397 domain-containing protein n=1 Tax=Thermopolyspora sp. NPDC052614 TaxID=3155682 RepID=UPI00344A6BFA